MTKLKASLSLDLDNKWSYMKTRGDARWRDLPSYLPTVVPRLLELAAHHRLKLTVFVVGQDAAIPEHAHLLRAIVEAGHEIGNHSFSHEPWLHLYGREKLIAEIARTEEAIEAATGGRPRGFRGPGYSSTPALLQLLHERSYRYDASTLPTFIGPAARAYYFLAAKLTAAERRERQALFGSLQDGLRPVRPYYWQLDQGLLLEIPVTTLPGLKVPFHPSYGLWMATWSPKLALAYFRSAMHLCRLAGVGPSVLLHPLDLLGREDGHEELSFFPAMSMPREVKRELLAEMIGIMQEQYDVGPVGVHAEHLESTFNVDGLSPRSGLKVRVPKHLPPLNDLLKDPHAPAPPS